MIKRMWRIVRDRPAAPTVEHDPCVPPTVVRGAPNVMPKHRGPVRRLRRRR